MCARLNCSAERYKAQVREDSINAKGKTLGMNGWARLFIIFGMAASRIIEAATMIFVSF